MSRFGEAIWSETEDGFAYIPFNDVFLYSRYTAHVVNFMAQIAPSPFWKQLCNRLNHKGTVLRGGAAVTTMILYTEYPEEPEYAYPDEFISLDVTGVTALRREDPQFGRTALYAISGRSFPGHQHEDKGSFMLEADGKRLLALMSLEAKCGDRLSFRIEGDDEDQAAEAILRTCGEVV
jgi:hypothetical protein